MEETERSTVRSPTSTMRPPRISGLTLLLTLRLEAFLAKEDLLIDAVRALIVLLSRGVADVIVASTIPLAALVRVSNLSATEARIDNLLFSAKTLRKFLTVASPFTAEVMTLTTDSLSLAERAGLERICSILESWERRFLIEERADSVELRVLDLAAAVY